jgi:hypothetical protein
MVIVVVVIFAACWMPLQIIFVLQYFGSPDDDSPVYVVAKVVASCLAYMNSCVNPILYAFLSDNFRKGFWRLLACGKAAGGGAGSGRGFGARFRSLNKLDMERTSIRPGTAAATTLTGTSNRDRSDETLQSAV